MTDLAAQLIVAILSGAAVAIITVNLSLRRFYSERWWERKAQAYSEIVEALYVVQLNISKILSAYERGQELTDDEHKALATKASDALTEIHKVTSIGAFIISDAAADSLRLLEADLEQARQEEAWFNLLDAQQFAVKQAMVRIREIARRELKHR